jgi:hypothetical protein
MLPKHGDLQDLLETALSRAVDVTLSDDEQFADNNPAERQNLILNAFWMFLDLSFYYFSFLNFLNTQLIS